jgi:hypothetical protein
MRWGELRNNESIAYSTLAKVTTLAKVVEEE